MSSTQQIFKNRLRIFEQTVLNQFGYYADPNEVPTVHPETKILAYRFYFKEKHLKITMFAFDIEDGRKSIVFMMDLLANGNPLSHRFFNLHEFLSNHKITSLNETCYPGEDFEEFTKKYFLSLEDAFNTYLRDQVTGVHFEGHNELGK